MSYERNRKRKKKNFIMPQMFDVKPLNEQGELDILKITKIERTLKIKPKRLFHSSGKAIGKVFYDVHAPVASSKKTKKIFQERKIPVNFFELETGDQVSGNIKKTVIEFRKQEFYPPEKKEDLTVFLKKKKSFSGKNIARLLLPKSYFSFALSAAAIFLIIFTANFFSIALGIKDSVLENSQEAYASLVLAKDQLAKNNFSGSSLEFSEAYNQLDKISQDLDKLGNIAIESSKFLPYFSRLSSGSHLVEAGKKISKIGLLTSETLTVLEKTKKDSNSHESISYLNIFKDLDENLKETVSLLEGTQKDLAEINTADIPEDKRGKFILLKNQLPGYLAFLKEFSQNSQVLEDILGGNGPRKYLFLFQNNQEMRATGGFIGSYALLDIFNGRVRNFFVDGIFNPDGQLKEKVVPPAPIQKISASWSLHDSNWFPDFPVSAEKAIWFYEKTGGPTVDGVITMTPTVLEKLLEITGPIEMPEYGVTIDKDNFLENIQYEVEVGYDKELNQPKKILSDLAPKILDKVFNASDFSEISKTLGVLSESLSEKHILIYSTNWEIEKILSERGFSGKILSAQKDYLSVINTNINGYKTDGVVEEEIYHSAQIQEDGSVIDTVTVKRHHNGGNSQYEWWNKVNADYMRLYVPQGSKLLEVSGQTREFDSPPLDYAALGFKADPQVKMEEDSMVIDEESGTKIYNESDKTVFANWVYVSPQETAEITYKYILPFKVGAKLKTGTVNTYSVLFQKQAGSLGSKLVSQVDYPASQKIIWKYPDEISDDNHELKMETDLKTDKYIGVALSGN